MLLEPINIPAKDIVISLKIAFIRFSFFSFRKIGLREVMVFGAIFLVVNLILDLGIDFPGAILRTEEICGF